MRKLLVAITIALVTVGTAQARTHHHKHHHYSYRHHGHYHRLGQGELRHAQYVQPWAQSEGIVNHPSGCPRTAFCGCGVAEKVFGAITRATRPLFLAANWGRYFAPASPAPGMVAYRSHHVFYIEQTYGDGTVLAYDPNSGGHQTRIHRRSLAGFRVVNPHQPRGHFSLASNW
ncbi:MAG TPA: hypothetical protein VFR24_27295 [Candidatus Angelobacter sp.]|nr:hypothetical protein [Candidatus Angelobacter sp.]